MSKSTDASKSNASSTTDTEIRLKAAIEAAALKKNFSKYSQNGSSTSPNSLSTVEMRLIAAMKMATSKRQIGKNQEHEILATVFPVSAPTQSINKNAQQNNLTKETVVLLEGKTKVSEPNWLVRQAMKLLGNLNRRLRTSTK